LMVVVKSKLSDNEVKCQCQFIVCKQYTVLYKKCVIKEYDGTIIKALYFKNFLLFSLSD